MKKPLEHDLLEPNTFDVLSATWVCACNDETSIITYESIRHRLNLGPSFDIKGLIQSRGDLFRQTVPSRRLEAWKQDMRLGKRLPSWIREISEDALRSKTIDEITPDDAFSQPVPRTGMQLRSLRQRLSTGACSILTVCGGLAMRLARSQQKLADVAHILDWRPECRGDDHRCFPQETMPVNSSECTHGSSMRLTPVRG